MKQLLVLLVYFTLFHPCTITQSIKQKTPSETVRSFVKWYGKNWGKLDGAEASTINMGPLDLKKNQEPPNYTINFKGVERYITALDKTGFFSEAYFEALRKWFKDADKNFNKNPQNDGPPDGFQADRFFLTQDNFLEDIENIDTITITQKILKNGIADVRMHFPLCHMTYHYRLSNKKGKWQIDSIANIEFSCRLPKANR